MEDGKKLSLMVIGRIYSSLICEQRIRDVEGEDGLLAVDCGYLMTR